MRYFADSLWWLLERFRETTGSYGLAVIGLTLLVRLALAPLGLAQFRALQGQKKLQPLVAELQKKYKDRPQELQRRLMDLYRQHKVNPLSGCLPLIVQFPVLVGLYQALTRLPQGATFLLWDLGGRDPYLILPLLAALTTYWSMRPGLNPGMDSRQSQMMWIMSGVTAFITYTLPAGLVLYWVVSNVFTVAQMWLFNRQLAVAEGSVRAR